MFGATFQYDTIRKMVILFGTLFNDIYINRKNSSNEVIQTLKVPLMYSSKEKMMARLNADPNLDRPFAMTLPRMGFEILEMNYDGPRKRESINKLVRRESTANSSILKYQYNPVPYNMMFNLYIMVKNAVDGTQIVEQILPFFTPEWTATVQFVSDPEIKLDVPVVLQDIALEDAYDGNFETRRALVYTITFIVKTWMLGPTKKQPVIKRALINPYATSTNADFSNTSNLQLYSQQDISIITTPGLTANGEPTTDPDETIPYGEINKDDNWDFIIQFEEAEPNE